MEDSAIPDVSRRLPVEQLRSVLTEYPPVTALALFRFLGRGVARTASRIADLRAGS